MSAGNLGSSHSTRTDVFISSDGGVEWDEALLGEYYYQILDHGGLAVAAPKSELTNQIW